MVLVIPVFIPHQGCPHDCLFCNQQEISGYDRGDRRALPVADTIDQWLSRRGGRSQVQVAFYGGSFTCMTRERQEELLSAVQPYIDRREVDTIRLSTRPDCIDSSVIELLQNHRVGVVELGVQSLTEEVLRKSRRGHSAKQSLQALTLLKEAGLTVGIQLMPGLPGETTGSFLKTVDTVIRRAPDFVRLYPALVVRDSGLQRLHAMGKYRPMTLNKAIALTARSCQRLESYGIEVVRMGLQPTDSLAQSIVAGPYHPAFGELVRSRLWLKQIRAEVARLEPMQKLHIYISHRDMSAVVGRKRCNIRRLEELGFSGRFAVTVDKSMERRSIRYVVS
jgi:histone acetyltransferase (RNA polymerase elongator complex component)